MNIHAQNCECEQIYEKNNSNKSKTIQNNYTTILLIFLYINIKIRRKIIKRKNYIVKPKQVLK